MNEYTLKMIAKGFLATNSGATNHEMEQQLYLLLQSIRDSLQEKSKQEQ